MRHEDSVADAPEPVANWHTPAHAAEFGVEKRRVIELLLLLPAKQRAVLAWILDGFTTQKSAEAMGITAEAARQNLSRARATLNTQLRLEVSDAAGEEGS
ncbi:sigma factor-like helix-turn-helix DNA-binding protein [Streptomyces sp. NPDC048479]|uniref:sigma factor-like helix-turn-helix DNA-binding protein n=1 Tax=Streptomyces sp. NPDC048479 TaxID=3154725 RepID=UPI00344AF6CB